MPADYKFQIGDQVKYINKYSEKSNQYIYYAPMRVGSVGVIEQRSVTPLGNAYYIHFPCLRKKRENEKHWLYEYQIKTRNNDRK